MCNEKTGKLHKKEVSLFYMLKKLNDLQNNNFVDSFI